MITVQRLSTPELIEEASALLYKNYIEEEVWNFSPDNPSQLHVRIKNGKKLLIDRFTNSATWFGAFDGKKLVGCIRLCGVDENNRFEIEGYPTSQIVLKYLSKVNCVEMTRAVVDSSYRGQKVLNQLYLISLKYCLDCKYSVFGTANNAFVKSLLKRIEFPLKIEQAFKYESQDAMPVNFYFASYENAELENIIKKLKELQSKMIPYDVFGILKAAAPLLPVPVYWHDINGVVLGLNEHCLKGMGTTLDIIGKTPYDFYPKETAEHILKHNEKIMSTGEILSQEESIHDITTGEKKYYKAVKAPLYDYDGKVIGIVGTSVDIGAEKEAEHLRLENTVAEQKAKIAAMLAASIAHELRTPLASISMLAGETDDIMETLVKTYKKAAAQGLAEGKLQSRQLENALTIGHELRRTAQSTNIFINMMLMKVNLEQPKSAKLVKLSMNDVISKALSLYPLRGSDVMLLEWNAADNKDFYFMGDATLFNHILFNLLKNALYHIKATQKGRIQIWLEMGKKHNFLHFKDTGPGIPAEILPHIFDVFYSKTTHGTGVGLALCKMIMTEFGGKISCDSLLGEYTHFILELPKLR